MRTSDYRKAIPLRVQLVASLLQLGLDPGAVELDHDPPLGLREWDEEKQDWVPSQHDPRHLVWRTVEGHATKTNGKPATSYGSDKHAIAKAKRIIKGQAEFRARILRKESREPQPKSKWPKRPFNNRRKSTARAPP